MKPSEVVLGAIEVLNTAGWCQGAAARDNQGNDIPLYEVSTNGDGRTRINAKAAAFSIYGAIAKVLQDAGSAAPQTGTMWDTLSRLAVAIPSSPKEPNHTHIHPVVLYNEDMDRTKEQVIAFLTNAASELAASEAVPA